jgi:hypothetical protein
MCAKITIASLLLRLFALVLLLLPSRCGRAGRMR